MNSPHSRTFFTKLKETCKKIDTDVKEIKRKLYEVPDNASDLAAKSVSDIQDKIKKTNIEANELKAMLEPKLAHTADFIQHFKELTAETEVSVAKLQNFLQQYGYNPLNVIVGSPPPEKNDTSEIEKQFNQETEHISKTPNLLDYGIVSHQYSSHALQFKDRKSSFEDLVIPRKLQLKSCVKDKENSDSTPTLEINFIPVTEDDTPPLPEFLPSHVPFPSTPTLEL